MALMALKVLSSLGNHLLGMDDLQFCFSSDSFGIKRGSNLQKNNQVTTSKHFFFSLN